MPTMYVLRGIPGSGKSTWRENRDLPYVNRDELRLQYSSERDVIAAENQFISEHMAMRIDFIVDNTHVSQRSIDRLRAMAEAQNYTMQVVEFRVPLHECIYRDRTRNRTVGRSVILKMAMDIGWYEDQLLYVGNTDSNVSVSNNAIIVDMDGTIANLKHRLHFLEGKKDWKSFFQNLVNDTPYDHITGILDRYADTHKIIIVTGRSADYVGLTEQ